jgi:hypothetical protein
MEEKRMYPRVGTVNLISYISVDKDGNKQSQGMGTAQNISQHGLRIETNRMIESEYISLLSNDREDNLVEIKGKVVFCRQAQTRKFETGICFQGTKEEKIQFVKNLVRAFNTRKNNVHSSNWGKNIQPQSCRI